MRRPYLSVHSPAVVGGHAVHQRCQEDHRQLVQLSASARGVLHHNPVHDERGHDPQEAQTQPHVARIRGLVPSSP